MAGSCKNINGISRNLGDWNCILKHVIEEKIEGKIERTGRRGRRLKQLLIDLNEKTGYGPVVRLAKSR
jgi:hypothetical protein